MICILNPLFSSAVLSIYCFFLIAVSQCMVSAFQLPPGMTCFSHHFLENEAWIAFLCFSHHCCTTQAGLCYIVEHGVCDTTNGHGQYCTAVYGIYCIAGHVSCPKLILADVCTSHHFEVFVCTHLDI